MIYQGFAYLYDQLMSDAPYDEWVDLISASISSYLPHAKEILDVGCGTGSVTIRLAEKQFDVTGVDLSEDMLTVAQAKCNEANVQVRLLQQDMRELAGFTHPFDVVTICCDSLNYLENEKDVKSTFHAVNQQLKPGGLFIFDVHSIFKINEIFAGATFAEQDEDISYIWKSYNGDKPNSVEHDLTFFVLQNGYYERYDELHRQRTFSITDYSNWLKEASFDILTICADFNIDNTPSETSERIFFVARKK